jgi:hypothetical protein
MLYVWRVPGLSPCNLERASMILVFHFPTVCLLVFVNVLAMVSACNNACDIAKEQRVHHETCKPGVFRDFFSEWQ